MPATAVEPFLFPLAASVLSTVIPVWLTERGEHPSVTRGRPTSHRPAAERGAP